MNITLNINLYGLPFDGAVIGKPYKPTVQARYTNPDQFAKIKQSILAEFNGHNYDELAGKYCLTPRYIQWLVTQSRTDADTDTFDDYGRPFTAACFDDLPEPRQADPRCAESSPDHRRPAPSDDRHSSQGDSDSQNHSDTE